MAKLEQQETATLARMWPLSLRATQAALPAKGIQQSESCRRTERAGLCLFCLMLYPHHPRTGGTQICVGKCQAVTIDDTCLSPYEMTPDVLVGVETLQRA